jgi:nucleoside-diphosphate-sugar epimerase
MTPARILIAGSGYVGTPLAAQLRADGHQVWTLRRHPPADAIDAIQGDLTQPDTLALPEALTHVVFCAGLKQADTAAYEALFLDGLRGLLQRLTNHPLRRFLFTSSTGVYGVTDGSVVDETTPTTARRVTARYYQHAEQHIQTAPFSTVIARLSGIYGPGRDRLVRQVEAGEAQRQPGPPRYMNLIHRDDAAGALAHLLFLPDPQPLYLVSDNESADRNEVITWLANALNLPQPPVADTPAPLGRGGNKRCTNQRLRDSGYACRYPTYREGYTALLKNRARA